MLWLIPLPLLCACSSPFIYMFKSYDQTAAFATNLCVQLPIYGYCSILFTQPSTHLPSHHPFIFSTIPQPGHLLPITAVTCHCHLFHVISICPLPSFPALAQSIFVSSHPPAHPLLTTCHPEIYPLHLPCACLPDNLLIVQPLNRPN